MHNISAVNARINEVINNHKITSYIIAGSLLASIAFVGASAIVTKGQIAKDSQEVPMVVIPTANKTQEDKAGETGQVKSANATSDVAATTPSLTLASTAPAVATTTPTVVTPVATTLPPVQQPVQTPTEAPVNPTPVDETPVDPVPLPGFQLTITNIDALGMFYPDENDNWRLQVIGDMEVIFDEDYVLDGKNLTIETSTAVEGAECGIEPDKGWVYFSFPASTPAGEQTCEVTISDGTVSSTALFTIDFTAPGWML